MDKLINLINKSNDLDTPIVITDRDWDGGGPFIIYANHAWEQMTEYDLEESKGKNPKFLQGPKTRKEDLKDIREVLNRPIGIFKGKTWNYKKSGQPFIINWIIYNMPFLEKYYIAAQRDITNQKESVSEVETFIYLNEILRAINEP